MQHRRKEAPAFKYISDGSGRDSYILYNSGGLQQTYRSGSTIFKESLRHSESQNSRRASPRQGPSDSTLYQNWYAPYERKVVMKSASIQKEAIRRLTRSPREVENPERVRNIRVKGNVGSGSVSQPHSPIRASNE